MLTYLQIKAYANKKAKDFNKSDSRFQADIILQEIDGSMFLYTDAFVEQKEQYLIIYTKIDGQYAFLNNTVTYKKV